MVWDAIRSLFTLDGIASLVTLTAMEIVLGIDNIVFIAVLVGRLPPERRHLARQLGLGIALGTRLLLLLSLSWLTHDETLQSPLFIVTGASFRLGVSVRDLILLGGGLFLIGKSTFEIHDKLEAHSGPPGVKGSSRFGWTLVEIGLLDIVFSLDSVITAIGMASQVVIMVVAMILAVGVMLLFAGPIGDFVHRHPTIKMLALSFLILIGVMLVADGLHQHIDRGYIYFAMAFSLVVELLNMRVRRNMPGQPGKK